MIWQFADSKASFRWSLLWMKAAGVQFLVLAEIGMTLHWSNSRRCHSRFVRRLTIHVCICLHIFVRVRECYVIMMNNNWAVATLRSKNTPRRGEEKERRGKSQIWLRFWSSLVSWKMVLVWWWWYNSLQEINWGGDFEFVSAEEMEHRAMTHMNLGGTKLI